MATRTPVLFSWSGGKDSALALHTLLQDPAWEVVGLLTSVADEYRRISHHGVREELLAAQAAALDLPLDILRLPAGEGACTNDRYETLLRGKLEGYRARGVRHVAHGDIFLVDLRAWREQKLAQLDMHGLFPIWGRDTRELVCTFVALGFQAVLCCVEGAKLGPDWVGRPLDLGLLADLPADVDPCGERGEYHSFVYDGPIFRSPIRWERGVTVQRQGRYYLDLLPASDASPARSPTDQVTPAAIPPV
jgi:uncharacterized protein (TIGR00290 family)